MKEETEALKRGRDFVKNRNKDKNGEKISSGFWLSNDQLIELANDLKKQGSHGIGFMVGKRNDRDNKRKKIYSVEIVPLINTNKTTKIEDECEKKGDTYFGIIKELKKSVKIHLKGHINTDLKILHTDINSNEGQRFPPPFPEE